MSSLDPFTPGIYIFTDHEGNSYRVVVLRPDVPDMDKRLDDLDELKPEWVPDGKAGRFPRPPRDLVYSGRRLPRYVKTRLGK